MIANRIGRMEFLFWCGMPMVVGSVALAVAAASVGGIDFRLRNLSLEMALAPAVLLATIVILRAEVSRFHDLGFSGWWMVATFVPLAGVVAFLILALVPGEKGQNDYGEPSLFLERWRGYGGVVTPE